MRELRYNCSPLFFCAGSKHHFIESGKLLGPPDPQVPEALFTFDDNCNVFLFSDHGAIQLSTDFGFLRTWISNNETLKEESRRYLLLLDSIRQCEGVARLLLSRPGDLVDIKPAKNKVAPIGNCHPS